MVFEQISRLALKVLADGFQRREPYALDFPLFEQGKIGFGNPYKSRQLFRAHLASRKHHVEMDGNGHVRES